MIRFYLFANILLALTLLIFTIAPKLFALLNLRAPHRHWLRWGQGLLLLSVLAPAACVNLPGRELPELQMPSFRSGDEGESPKKSTAGLQIKKPFMPRDPSPLAQTLYDWNTRDWKDPFLLGGSLWLIGLGASAWSLRRKFARLSSLLREANPVRQLGAIKVAVSSQISVPISTYRSGIYWVILPANLLGNPRDWSLALQHELQHHRQGDTLWALAIEGLKCAFYLNPAVYLWQRQIIEFQEFSCDEALVGQARVSPREYGSCLVRVAETALGCPEAYVGTTYMAAATRNPRYFKSFLQRRIEMLVKQNARPRKWLALGIGTLGVLVTVSLAYGIEQSARSLTQELPNPGTVVVDERIQKLTDRILRDALAAEEASDGFAIVADPQTGRILAVSNIDTTNKRTGYWSLAQVIEPASAAKSLVVAEAIEAGKVSPDEIIDCGNGSYKFGNRIFHDWKEGGFGRISLSRAVAHSSDICTVRVAERLGLEGVHGLLEKFGFGPGGTASEFPGARAGYLPPRNGAMGRYFIPLVAYGQGFRSNAIEMVQAYGAIANGGTLLMPLPANATDGEKRIVRQVISAETAEKMKGILQDVVLHGTGQHTAQSFLYTTAGKTASAFIPDNKWLEESRGTRNANFAGFIGFAPVNNPRVEVYVGVRNPKRSTSGPNSGAHGSEHAAPVFKQIAEAVLQYLQVPPDNL